LRTYVVVLETEDLLRSALNDYDLSLGLLRHVGIFLLGVSVLSSEVSADFSVSADSTGAAGSAGVSAGTAGSTGATG